MNATTYLEMVAVTCACLFAYAVWPPALLLAVSVSAFAVSWALERRR